MSNENPLCDNYRRFKAHLNTHCYLLSLLRSADKTHAADTDNNYIQPTCVFKKDKQQEGDKSYYLQCVCLSVQYEMNI